MCVSVSLLSLCISVSFPSLSLYLFLSLSLCPCVSVRVRLTLSHCNTLLHSAIRCYTLLHAATRCNTLQHTATHCKHTYVLLKFYCCINLKSLRLPPFAAYPKYPLCIPGFRKDIDDACVACDPGTKVCDPSREPSFSLGCDFPRHLYSYHVTCIAASHHATSITEYARVVCVRGTLQNVLIRNAFIHVYKLIDV